MYVPLIDDTTALLGAFDFCFLDFVALDGAVRARELAPFSVSTAPGTGEARTEIPTTKLKSLKRLRAVRSTKHKSFSLLLVLCQEDISV
jgi:hypothetical protein